jgi:cell division protein ZipA
MSTLRWILLGVGAIILLLIYIFDRRGHAGKGEDIFANRGESGTDALLDPIDKELDEPLGAPSKAAYQDLETQELDALAEQLSGHTEPEVSRDTAKDADVRGGEQQASAEVVGLDKRPREETNATPIETEPVALEGAAPMDTEPTGDAKPSGGNSVVVMYVVAPDGQPFKGQAILKAFHAHKLRFGELDVFHRIRGKGDDARTIFSISNMLNPGTLIPEDLVHADVKGLSLFMKLPSPGDSTASFDDMLHCAKHISATLGGELKDEALAEMTQDKITEQRQQLKRAFA